MFTDLVSRYLPQDWTPMDFNHQDYELVTIRRKTYKYRKLNDKTGGDFRAKTKKIVRVQNPYLYGQFLLKQEEYERYLNPNIVELFHDTSENNVPSIVSGNLDWRLANRVKFGKGVSFSPYPDYANQQSNWDNGCDRAMIIADVLVGRKENTRRSKTLPDDGFDTSVGNHDNVYVKYYDNEFYPKYIVFYTNVNY